MATGKTETLDALKTAMEAELTGHNFYMNAARNVQDTRARETFLEMAEDEKHHFSYLRHQYASVLESGTYDFAREFIRADAARGENPIFSDAIKERIRECHYEISVLTIGLKLELDAIRFYRACAGKADTEEARKMYEALAEWEEGHCAAFERELESLKEDYWQANNFVPLT